MLPPATSDQASAASTTSFFKGDADNLVDRLIAACETKVKPATPYTGFGRDLVPFFGEADVLSEQSKFGTLETRGTTATKNGGQKGGSRPSEMGGRTSPQSKKQKQQGKNVQRGSRSPPAGRIAGQQDVTNAPVSPVLASGGVALTPQQQAEELESAFAGDRKVGAVPRTQRVRPGMMDGPGLNGRLGCPIFASPKPETIPLPTNLLTRASRLENVTRSELVLAQA